MNAEFNWWLLIVGLVVGAGLVWLVVADWSRREQDVSDEERSAESAWIAQEMHQRGEHVDPEAAHEILALHREYLRRTGDLDPPEDSPDSDDRAWPDGFSDLPEPDDGPSWPADGGWDTQAPGPANRTRATDDEADWNVRRTSAEHRSVRSGPRSLREEPAPGPDSDPPSP